MNPFHYSKPVDVQEAVHLSSGASRFIAGGTNLLDLMKENISRPEHLIDITGLPLHDIQETTDGGLLIGLMELLAQTKQTAEFSANLFEAFTLATLIYFTLNTSLCC